MKKIIGWLQVIFCSLLLLTLLMCVTVLLPDMLSPDPDHAMPASSIMTTSFGFLLFGIFLFIGLRNGLKKIKAEKPVERKPFEKELNIQLSGRIEYKDYRNLLLGLSYKKPVMLIFLGILVFSSLSMAINGEEVSGGSKIGFYVFFGIFLLSPILSLIQIKKLYWSNKVLVEPMTYTLNNHAIHISGETVSSTQSWSHFYSIKETDHFFILYQGKMIATLLHKNMFSAADLFAFKEFIRSLDVKKELLK